MAKKTAQINIRVEDNDLAILTAIEDKHYINPSLLTRGLLKAAIKFYEENGWFSFPVSVSCELPPNTMTVGGKIVPASVSLAQEQQLTKKKPKH